MSSKGVIVRAGDEAVSWPREIKRSGSFVSWCMSMMCARERSTWSASSARLRLPRTSRFQRKPNGDTDEDQVVHEGFEALDELTEIACAEVAAKLDQRGHEQAAEEHYQRADAHSKTVVRTREPLGQRGSFLRDLEELARNASQTRRWKALLHAGTEHPRGLDDSARIELPIHSGRTLTMASPARAGPLVQGLVAAGHPRSRGERRC